MRFVSLTSLSLLLAQAAAAQTDSHKLQGYWNLKEYEVGSEKRELLRLLHGLDVKRVVKEETRNLAVQKDTFAFNGLDLLRRAATARLDAGKIDLTSTSIIKGAVYLGIYNLDGDDLILCISDGSSRPTEFRAKPGQVLLRYKKVVPGGVAPKL